MPVNILLHSSIYEAIIDSNQLISLQIIAHVRSGVVGNQLEFSRTSGRSVDIVSFHTGYSA
jgi:hypothetical protein